MLSVNSGQHGLRIVQRLPASYETYQTSIANGIVAVTPNPPFQLLVANLGTQPQRLAKQHVIRSVALHPLAMLLPRVRAADVLGIVKEKEESTDQKSSNNGSSVTGTEPVDKPHLLDEVAGELDERKLDPETIPDEL